MDLMKIVKYDRQREYNLQMLQCSLHIQNLAILNNGKICWQKGRGRGERGGGGGRGGGITDREHKSVPVLHEGWGDKADIHSFFFQGSLAAYLSSF